MPNYILETKFTINGRLINCKVTDAPEGSPFILDIRGGPGQQLSTGFPDYFNQRTKGQPEHHFILFDALGCGESDRALNPDEEYSTENFTEIAARVVEEVAVKLQIAKMHLRVVGGSYGGLLALNLPTHRPEWTHPDSPIRLHAIYPFIAPLGLRDCMSEDFISEQFKHDRRLPRFLRAAEKVRTGNIEDRNDFIAHVIAPSSAIYGDAYDKFPLNACLAILSVFPNSFYYILSALKLIKPFRAFAERNFEWLYKFSYEVTKYLFKNNYHGFEWEDKIKQNPELLEVYNRISIFAVYGASDLSTSGNRSLARLQQTLPTIGSLLHPGKHHDNVDTLRNLLINFFSGDYKKFENALIESANGKNVITIPETFRDNFIAFNRIGSSLSTVTLMSVMHDAVKPVKEYSIDIEQVEISQAEADDRNQQENVARMKLM